MTGPSPLCEPGAVVLVRFTFTSQTQTKRRPAVILTGDRYHSSRLDAMMVPLSTQAGGFYGDSPVTDWQAAGLSGPTNAKGIIQTIERSTVDRRIGTLSDQDFAALKTALRSCLGL